MRQGTAEGESTAVSQNQYRCIFPLIATGPMARIQLRTRDILKGCAFKRYVEVARVQPRQPVQRCANLLRRHSYDIASYHPPKLVAHAKKPLRKGPEHIGDALWFHRRLATDLNTGYRFAVPS